MILRDAGRKRILEVSAVCCCESRHVEYCGKFFVVGQIIE
jgi:hypothetical protein